MTTQAKKKKTAKKTTPKASAKKRPGRSTGNTGPGRTVEDFRRIYDKDYIVPRAIDAALEKLSDDEWRPEVEFIKMVQDCAQESIGHAGAGRVSTVDFSLYREQFEDYMVRIPKEKKRVWCGSKKLAIELQGMVQ